MQYSYRLHYKNGATCFSVQDHLFTEEQMLKACKESKYKEFKDVVKVEYHRHIPKGWHLCGCGNLVTHGPQNELCDECKEIYGHTYEDEL